MADIFSSISLVSGMLVIPLVSVLAIIIWFYALKKKISWMLAVIFPAIFSYSIYWAPVWLGEPPDGAWSWAPILIGVWFVTGAVGSVVAIFLIKQKINKRMLQKE